jgi:hypothetical protein
MSARDSPGHSGARPACRTGYGPPRRRRPRILHPVRASTSSAVKACQHVAKEHALWARPHSSLRVCAVIVTRPRRRHRADDRSHPLRSADTFRPDHLRASPHRRRVPPRRSPLATLGTSPTGQVGERLPCPLRRARSLSVRLGDPSGATIRCRRVCASNSSTTVPF